MARAPKDGPRGSRPPGVGPFLPWAPHAINQIRRGVATVIARRTAALLPRPRDQDDVIRSAATVTRSAGGAHQRRAPGVGGEDGHLRDRQLGPAPSRITIVPRGVGLYKPPGTPMQRVGSFDH